MRCYQSETPPDEILLKLVAAAITAPSAGNKQPWRFLIVKDRETIISAAQVVEQACTRLKALCRPDLSADLENYVENFTIFKHAPVIIIPIVRFFMGLKGVLEKDKLENDETFLDMLEADATQVSVGMAIQNILLMGQTLGLGTCCMTGPLIAKTQLEQHLEVPQGWHIAAIIAVGYPDEVPADPGRKSLKTFVRWL